MNIDELIQLGKEGKPDEIEAERERLFQEVIATVENPEQRCKLEGLHFQLRNIRYKYKDPYMAALKANELMMGVLLELNEELHKLAGELRNL